MSTSSQQAMDRAGLGSMLSVGQVPFSLTTFTTAGVLLDAEDPTNIMRLLFVKPEVKSSISASYEEVKTLGRTIPIIGYINTSGRNITLDISFIADVSPMLQVDRKIKWLKTFMYPRDTASAIRPPKKIIVCMGMYLWLKGVVTDVSEIPKKPFGGLATEYGFLSMFPQAATVQVSIKETENFWTGGQMTYEEAVLDMNYRIGGGSGVTQFVGNALNFL